MWDFKRSFLHGLRDLKDHAPVVQRSCNVPGCASPGDYRAPKSRYDLKDYYWFCLEHVQVYNQNWDFFKGMTPGEIEHHMHRTATWDRPTWRMTQAGFNEERAREKIYTHFTSGDGVYGDFRADGDAEDSGKAQIDVDSIPHPTVEALSALDLQPPVTWPEVKARYKTLAKRYHPDMNKDAGAEELLKKVNLAYSILKLSWQHYTQLEEKS